MSKGIIPKGPRGSPFTTGRTNGTSINIVGLVNGELYRGSDLTMNNSRPLNRISINIEVVNP